MKKNLLALIALSAIYSVNAQDTNIKDAVIVKVNPNTLFYNGGTLNITTDQTAGTTEKIINQGNIQVKGNFNNTNTTGKNFVNQYTTNASYGQLIIDNVSTVAGNVAMERSNINSTNNDYFPFGLPYQGANIETIFNNIVGSTSYKGNCAIDVQCSERYLQSLLSWDIKQSEYDHVPTGTPVVPGSNYTINTMNGTFRTFLQGISAANKFATYGKPNNKALVLNNVESGIRNKTKAEFSELTWGNWKNLINNYNEDYDSYLGNSTASNTNARYAKNLHRFSNPFTSNIDLSDVSITNSWIKLVVNGTIKGPTETFEPTVIKFRINKLADNYTVDWNAQTGGSNANTTRINAYLQKAASGATPYFWAGNPDALIVKPFEYFEIDYYTMIKANNGGSNIVTSNINITDRQKTFSYDFATKGNTTGVFAKGNSSSTNTNFLNDETLKQKGLIAGNDFTQLELFLLDDNHILGEAAYLVNSSFYQTGNSTANSLQQNQIFLYEEKNDGTVVSDSQTLLNQFNALDYVGKPIRLGFNNLTEGKSYTINLRLFEQSILNKVENFSVGKYYLLDKLKNQIVELDADTQIKFIANANINNQFELYWNEKPSTLGNTELDKLNTTYVYKEDINKYVHFEKRNTSANIEIYDLAGRLISRNIDIPTNTDYKLNLNKSSGVYVVVITYKDGKVVSQKTIN